MMRSLLTALAACLVWAAPAFAQDDPALLRVVGSASVEVAPDHAQLVVGVRIQADSPEAAALEKGATEVGHVDFRSTERRQARSLALERAVEAARQDAGVLARGEVTNYTQGGIMLRGAVATRRADVITGSAITPQLLSVDAQVVVTWRVR